MTAEQIERIETSLLAVLERCAKDATTAAEVEALAAVAQAKDRRALFASYLAKLGDDRALPALMKAALDDHINYLDYVEVVNAIEALGGERPPERDFSGDPYYESLKRV